MSKDLILPVGVENAGVMFIKDSATEEEEKTGFCFTGNDEREFKSLCKNVGIPYETTYRTMLLKQKLGYNGHRKKQKDEAIAQAKQDKDYEQILKGEIFNIKPRVIVPLGELSLNFIAGEKSIAKYRGSILPLREDLRIEASKLNYSPKIVPTLGSQFFFLDPKARVYVSVDLGKVADILNNPIEIPRDLVWIADSVEKFKNFLDRYKNVEWGVFDIETKFNIPICISFCFSDVEAVTVPLVDSGIDNNSLVLLWTAVDNLFREKKWINQNIKFDIQKLHRFGFQIPEQNVIGDTAIRSNILYPEFPKNLGFLNSIYTNLPYHKDEGKQSKDRKKLYIYCAKDSLSTRLVYLGQEKELEEFSLKEFEQKMLSLFWPYVKMEERGILIDESKRRSLLAKYDTIYNINSTILEKYTKKGFNPHSPQQVAELLYKEYGIPEQKDRKTGNLQTGEETLELILRKFCNSDAHVSLAIKLIIGLRKIHKVIEYCETVIHTDGRLRGSWDLGGTNTGRTSCKATTDYKLCYTTEVSPKTLKIKGNWELIDCGRSLQTISKHGFKFMDQWLGRDLRSIFVPSPGYIFVEGDLAAAEARVDAVLAEDYDILETYDIPPGVHVKTGFWIFNKYINKKEEPELYHIAKTVRHAAERNLFPERCVLILAPFGDYDVNFCTRALNQIHCNQPNIRKVFHADVTNFVQKNRYLISPHGRRRGFFGNLNNETYNEAISTLPQAIVSDQIKFSIPLIEERMPSIRFLSENHDSLLAEIKKEELERYAYHFKNITSREIDFRKCSIRRDFCLKIPCEISWSDESWQEMKDFNFS